MIGSGKIAMIKNMLHHLRQSALRDSVIAREAGCPQSYIHDLKAGSKSNPGGKIVNQLCAVLGLDANTGEPEPIQYILREKALEIADNLVLLAHETGIPEKDLSLFIEGKIFLRKRFANILAAHFGVEKGGTEEQTSIVDGHNTTVRAKVKPPVFRRGQSTVYYLQEPITEELTLTQEEAHLIYARRDMAKHEPYSGIESAFEELLEAQQLVPFDDEMAHMAIRTCLAQLDLIIQRRRPKKKNKFEDNDRDTAA
jgi:hypothetical protein